MVDNDYMKFRELLKEKQYGEAATYLIEKPGIKNIINLDESLKIIDYYEEGLQNLMVKHLSEVSNDVKKLNLKLGKTIEKILGDKK